METRTNRGLPAASTKAPGGNEEGAGPKRLREPDKAAEITEKCPSSATITTLRPVMDIDKQSPPPL